MKKFIRIFLAVALIFCNTYNSYASFANPIIQRLVPSAAIAGAGGSITIPALIKGTTSGGGGVSSWISLAIPGGNVAKIAGAVIGVGIGLSLDYVCLKGAMWLSEKNLTKNPDGSISQNTTVNVPNGKTINDYLFKTGNSVGMGIFTSEAAGALAEAYRATIAQGSTGYNDSTLYGLAYFYCTNMDQNSAEYGQTKRWFISRSSDTHTETQAAPMSAAQIESMLTLDLASGNVGAMGFGKAAVEQAADAIENPSNSLSSNPSAMSAIQSALSSSITAGQKTNLEAQATTAGDVAVPSTADDTNQLTAAQIAAGMQGALQGQGLSATAIAAAIAAANPSATAAQIAAAIAAANPSATAAQIADAIHAANPSLTQAEVKAATKEGVKEAVDDETGVSMPIDTSFIVPTKLSLTTVLSDFMDSIKNMPFLAALQGVTVNCSGSSMLCLNLPSKFGGTVCWDAGKISGELNAIGSVFLSCTTIIMFIYIFRSN